MLRDQSGLTQQALASLPRVDRTNLVGLLNELESDGLVLHRRAAEDRRRHLVALIDAGRARLDDAEAALTEVEDDVRGALSRLERQALHTLLRQVTAGHVLSCGIDEDHGLRPADAD